MRILGSDRLVIASHNPGKVAEIEDLMRPWGVTVVPASALGLAEPAETEETFAGNARIKAHAAARATGLPALADDSGIEIEALGGAPGVHTADWAETGSGRDFARAMARVNSLLEEARAPHPRRARFVCTLCLAAPDGTDHLFEGEARGRVVWPMRGTQGHGFDPIFVPDGRDLTFAEMTPAAKNAISHRADAFAKFVAGVFGRRSPRRLVSTGSPFEATMGYSRAVVQGDWCFVSGVTGYDYAAMAMPDGVVAQARNGLATIARVLDEAGFAMADIVRVQYTVTDRAHVAELVPVLGEVFGSIRPAATMVVAGLIRPEMLVEIEATAFRG